ncbi:MAG: hypothetical protein KF850_13390 [Labilithrix sp.]|nr:hypothetical protein [Labilithrix sp.]
MNLRFSVSASIVSIALAIACSSSSTPSSPDYAGACQELASRCHGVGTPLGDECHDLGHDGDDAKCGPRRAECLAACPKNDAEDAGHVADDAGSDDAGRDAPADRCSDYCACMLSTCASKFANEAACLATCGAFSDEDFTCYSTHCEDAKTASDPAHDCEHASGDVACH